MTPAPAVLSRAGIVDAAVRIIDRDGADGFTMRLLGAELGVDPMAVYHHFRTKAVLFDAVVDSLWVGLTDWEPDADASWREIVVDLFWSLRTALLAHPGVIPIAATRPIASPFLIALTDRVVGVLAAKGLPSASAMRLLDCALAFAVGKLAAEVQRPVGGASATPEQTMTGLDPAHTPNLAAAVQGGYGWQPEREFEQGLEALVRGWEP